MNTTTTNSDDDGDNSSHSSSWRIDLTNFSKTKTQLDTALNDSTRCGEILSAYFDEQNTAFEKIPWAGSSNRPCRGIFPLHKLFFEPCKKGDDNAIKILEGNHYVTTTEEGAAILDELKTKHKDYFDSNKYAWAAGGPETGNCIGTYEEMLLSPSRSWDAFRAFYNHCKDTDKALDSMTHDQYKSLKKRCRRWKKANHHM